MLTPPPELTWRPICRRYATASTMLYVDRAIAHSGVSGVVTQDQMSAMLTDAYRDIGGALSLVADYRGAIVDMDSEAMMSRAAAQGRAARDTPVALVVAPDAVAFWRRYALLVAHRGFIRGVFTQYEVATAWAARKAAVSQAIRDSRSLRLAP